MMTQPMNRLQSTNNQEIKEQIDKQKEELEYAVTKALALAKKKGAQAAVSISKSTGISVSSRQCELENIEYDSTGALGVSVYKDQRTGSATTSDLTDSAIEKTVLAALDIATYTSKDPFSGLAPAENMVKKMADLDLFHPFKLDVAYAIEQAINVEKIALNYDKSLTSDGASFDSHYGLTVYGNSHDLLVSMPSSFHSLSCSLVGLGHNGAMERDYSYSTTRHIDDLWAVEKIAIEAAQRTVQRLNPRKLPKSGKMPVILHADIASGLFRHFASAISGVSVYKKSTFLLDYLDKLVFPKWLTIAERPHLLRGLGSANCDSEGVATIDRDIINKGILTTYLLSSYSARKLNRPVTGHAGGIYNWLINNSGDSLPMLLKQMGTGILVTELMGQGVNIVTGDYSRGASGFWVEQGEIQYPINGFTIAGDLKQMFMAIVAISNDVETRSSIQTGSILINSMNVAN